MKLLNKLNRLLKKPKNVIITLLVIIAVLMLVTLFSKVHEGMKNKSCDDTEIKLKLKLHAESGGSNRKINSATLYHGSTELGTATMDQDIDTGKFDSDWVTVTASSDCVKKPVTKVKFDFTGTDFKVSNMMVQAKMGNKTKSYHKKTKHDFPSEIHMSKSKN